MAGRSRTGGGRRAGGGGSADAEFRRELEKRKRESTLQLLFRAARLVDEAALSRVAALPGRPVLRRSHTSLFPHIDLEGTRITDLALRLGVTKQAVSQLVDDLEALGVVERVPDPEDARARRVLFTARGRAGLLEGLDVLASFEEELARRIGAERMDSLNETLVALLAAVEAGEPEDG